MPLNITVLATVIILLPMFYLLLASPAFLLVRLDIPQVAYLLRTMFSGYFITLMVTGLVATALNALDGRPIQSAGLGLVTAFAFVWRRWLMHRIDVQLSEIPSDFAGVAPRLRRLHWAGMLANAIQVAFILAFVPALVVAK